ncbi:MAG: hypothetical protein ACI9ES_002294 [Oceanospirillaceae bacterium]
MFTVVYLCININSVNNNQQIKRMNMSAVTVRAKSVIKLQTKNSNIDLEFQKGDHVQDMTMQLIHALVQNVGINRAKVIVQGKLDNYIKDYIGLAK